MFASLKEWIESIDEESRFFRDADDELLHTALAALIYHLVMLDERHSGRERREFEQLMKRELGLDAEQVDHLWRAASSAAGSLHSDLRTIHAHLKDSPTARMNFMQTLLQIINIHGVRQAELQLFFEALHEIFPEARETGLDPGT